MMRIVAWILLLVGVGMAAAGAARNGLALADHRGTLGVESVLVSARAELDAAHEAHSDALDAERAVEGLKVPQHTLDAVQAQMDAADARLASARAAVEALREAGTFDGSLNAAVVRAQAAHEAAPLPEPQARLMDWLGVGGVLWGIGVLLVGVGAFLERRSVAAAAAGTGKNAGAMVDFPDAVDRILAELVELAEDLADLPMDAPSATLRERIDILQDDVITPVVEGRGQLVARHGSSRFAVYFGSFSAGERNLARVWSALTDGHSVVARESLRASAAAFREARAAWDRAEAG